MKRLITKTVTALMMLFMGVSVSYAVNVEPYDNNVNYSRYIKYDDYLDVEIWTDDDEYYEDDNIQISFRADNDCFVAIYNVDTRGRVNLIFPSEPYEDNRIEGGRIYTIPGRYDDYDLTVQGPPGVEHLHIVASKNRIIIPDWFGGSGIVVDDDPYDYIEYLDAMFFDCENGGGCRRAFDMTSFVVKEWENYYFRPVYIHDHYHHYDPYWDWGLYGAVYIDYPFGATIYIDGVYWGVAPLYIPRIYYGWHYVTVYDHYGYCWEDRVNVIKTRQIVLDNTIIKTRQTTKSRFKEVRTKGYLDPVKNGYPNYKTQVATKQKYQPVSKTARIDKSTNMILDKNTKTTKFDSKYRSNTSKSKSTYRDYKSKRSNSDSRSTYKTTKRSDYENSSKKSTSSSKSKSYKETKRDKTSSGTKSDKTYKSTGKSTKSSSGSKSTKSTKSSNKSSSYKNKSSSSNSSGQKSSFSGSPKRSSGSATSSKSSGGGTTKRKR